MATDPLARFRRCLLLITAAACLTESRKLDQPRPESNRKTPPNLQDNRATAFDEASRKSDDFREHYDEKTIDFLNTDVFPEADLVFSGSTSDLEDSSLTVFDKKRHFEVSDMRYDGKNDDFDAPSVTFTDLNDYKYDDRGKSKVKIKKQPLAPLVVKSESSQRSQQKQRSSNRRVSQKDNSDTLLVSEDRSGKRERTREAHRRRLPADNSNSTISRPGSMIRELAAKLQLGNAHKMQNDRQDSLAAGVAVNPDDKGDIVNSYSPNGHSMDGVLSFNDKMRKLNWKLNDPALQSQVNHMVVGGSGAEATGISCDFEKNCDWSWNTTGPDAEGFEILSAVEILARNQSNDYTLRGPNTDADLNDDGHFLYLSVGPSTGVMTIRSPNYYGSTMENCKIEVWLHQCNMQNASFRVVTEPTNGAPPWVLSEVQGNNNEKWMKSSFPVGRVQQEFRLVLEVVAGPGTGSLGAHIAVDNIKMASCFAEMASVEKCSPRQLKCLANKVPACINSSRVCDILEDCDQGEDERQDCDKIPFGARCSFEDGWCGWFNIPTNRIKLQWSLGSGPTPTESTGPDQDHTCEGRTSLYATQGQSLLSNNDSFGAPQGACLGHYIFVNMAQHGRGDHVGFASNANMDSVIFNPPPRVHQEAGSKYFNSCSIRFYYHQYGKNFGSISLILVELREKENTSTTLWWSTKNRGPDWVRTDIFLPNVTTRYYLQFESRRGMRIYSDVAIDDFSMAPECFGINIPKDKLGNYNYWDPAHSATPATPHKDFQNKSYVELTTCGQLGRYGPTQQQCDAAYVNASTAIRVLEQEPLKGVQTWSVPNEGFYTIIVRGAGGGLGSGGAGSSRGSSVRGLLELHKGQVLHALVGQQGTSACIKTLSVLTESNCKQNNTSTLGADGSPFYHSKTHEIKNTVIQDGGGGGGGGSYLFLVEKDKKLTPLLVGGGGGGLGAGRASAGGSQHGRGAMPANKRARTGHMYGAPNSTPGAGGGWVTAPGLVTPGHEVVRGAAVSEGAIGGKACAGGGGPGAGGFGGGGGGCARGGAAGGMAGGDTSQNTTNGEGGYSFVNYEQTFSAFTEILPGMHSGPGQVFIIPAIEGCGCDFRCVALDEYRSKIQCICPEGWFSTGVNSTQCALMPPEDDIPYYMHAMILFGCVSLMLVGALTGIFLMLYNRYQVRKQAALRHKALLEQDLRLSRLRSTADDSALTSFNPNYGSDAVLAGGVDVRQLPQVARDSLRLVKALGQGAFGEVYQGLYRHRDGDAIEMPVAVKTLPEMSTGQSETDFLMEAAIMAKFNHPNIVHLIGVCFDRHPRFIVLELLAGGDLKNFLRENRPKPERSSSLGMKDLVLGALDVAKGCRYMETKRFIHRDIAARNCLLTSKGPGRVVKIADFGMARDIYRADYYRKGGKAMLPIKWMPPEAFLDGIFTSKTDVWSFGVLLWEVFSLGIMPYTGCANREVMQMVTGGGRLDIPLGCPMEIYRTMCDCWNPNPQDRPTFSQLFERLTHCTQDPELMSAPLPCFARSLPVPSEFDDSQNQALQVCGLLASHDYLVPLLPYSGVPGHSSSSDRLISSPHSKQDGAAEHMCATASGTEHRTPEQTYKQMHPPEYGNIALGTGSGMQQTKDVKMQAKAPSKMQYSEQSLPSKMSSSKPDAKFQPSKSTDRLLGAMEVSGGGGRGAADGADDTADEDSLAAEDGREWETSFTEGRAAKREPEALPTGPPVDKLISIDTPQQTPTSLQPPDNTLSRTMYQNRSPVQHPKQEHPPLGAKPKTPTIQDPKRQPQLPHLPPSINYPKQRPLCLDAAQLEQNLNALKKNSGSVNLNNMNILPPYVNVLTPNKLSKNSESRKIQIDPKKAVIHDLASPPGNTPSTSNENNPNDVEIGVLPSGSSNNASSDAPSGSQLKTSASSSSLLNGPLTDLPYADSDNGSSSSGSANVIGNLKSGVSKLNNYTEVNLSEEHAAARKARRQNSNGGGFLNNDSEINC